MRTIIALLSLAFAANVGFGQPAVSPEFSVASVKASARVVGKDYRKPLAVGADRLSGRNVSLKDLLVEAYGMEPFQVSGPGWLDANEYDVDARADGPVAREQLRLMLRRLVTERFRMAVHTEAKEARVHALVVGKDGPKIRPGAAGGFHGDLRELARIISIQLTIPPISDPGRPSMATGPPVPVVDKTGLAGIYDLDLRLGSPGDGDMFELWQRKLQDLGLRLESQKASVEFLVVDRAEKVPVEN
jgi:uncharacterized protein (TIGR03435 family)